MSECHPKLFRSWFFSWVKIPVFSRSNNNYRNYTSFIQDLTLFLNDSKSSKRLHFIPILRGLNALISRNLQEKEFLQDLKFFLQETLIENRNKTLDISAIKQGIIFLLLFYPDTSIFF